MKYIAIILIYFMMNTAQSQNNFNFNMDHIAIRVKDLDISFKFYSEIFGLKEIYNAGLGEGYRWLELNNKVQIHLIKSDAEVKKYKGVHIALNVNDLESFMSYLKSQKIQFENWPGEVNTTNTRPDGIKQIYLKDPDGYWIEINDNKF